MAHVPSVPCYMCGTEFTPSRERFDAWGNSGRNFDPTDWQCPACAKAEDEYYQTTAEDLRREAEVSDEYDAYLEAAYQTWTEGRANGDPHCQ